jgi:predicted pyridoxine 5'-phosphate oxidase superfamily flavin-nucleotide-binding protein
LESLNAYFLEKLAVYISVYFQFYCFCLLKFNIFAQPISILVFVITFFTSFKSLKMATLTQEMKEMIATQQCFIGTVDGDGIPNVAPKRSTRVLSDDSLIFTEGTGRTTYENIKRGSKVAVAVVNREVLDGYRFLGNAILLESGDLYEQAAAMSAKMGLPKPRAVAVVTITAIYSLKPGPFAGKQIG